MARYEHLPIYAKAYELAVLVERQVQGFSRYHKYAIGADLRALCRVMLRRVIRANNAVERRADELRALREAVEEFLVLVRLARDVKAFSALKTYEHCANLALSIGRQTEGWLNKTTIG